MVGDNDLLLLKLAFERRVIDAPTAARCVALAKAQRGQGFAAILLSQGKLTRPAVEFLVKLAAQASESQGAVIPSRMEMEDGLIIRLIEHQRVLDSTVIRRGRAEQKACAQNGQFFLLGELLSRQGLLSTAAYKKMAHMARGRLATCSGCYRHYVAPNQVSATRFPCRNCSGTVIVGDLPEAIYQEWSQQSHGEKSVLTGSSRSTRGADPMASTTRRQARRMAPELEQQAAAPKAAPASAGAGEGEIFMTGRFQALPLLLAKKKKEEEERRRAAEEAAMDEGEDEDDGPGAAFSADTFGADEELTVTLTKLQTDKDAKAAPKGAKFGKFEVLEEIARGGMGVVYKAKLKDRKVALKVLISGSEAGEAERQRFLKEGEIGQLLQHPGIVEFFSTGKIDNYPYLALEFIEGHTVEELLRDGAMAPKIAAQILREVSSAVHFAHGKGIVHRDLKPGNIIMAENGKPKIIDFGVAKTKSDSMRLTQSGAAIGTPYYMAPEQVRGDHDEVGPQSDVYALGVILYEMLTGDVPFRAENPIELYHKIASESVVLPSAQESRVPESLETICLCAMAKDAEDRYESAEELAKDLHRFLRGRPIEATRPSELGRRLQALLTNPVLLIIAAVLFSGAVIALVSYLK